MCQPLGHSQCLQETSSEPSTTDTKSMLTEYPNYQYTGLSGIEVKKHKKKHKGLKEKFCSLQGSEQ